MNEARRCLLCNRNYVGDAEEPCAHCKAIIKSLKCQDCARLKALCGELWETWRWNSEKHTDEMYSELKKRLKQEGIIK